jgi:hypothetical protein
MDWKHSSQVLCQKVTMSEWLDDCCLTPSEKKSVISWWEQVAFQWDIVECPLCTRPINILDFFYIVVHYLPVTQTHLIDEQIREDKQLVGNRLKHNN